MNKIREELKDRIIQSIKNLRKENKIPVFQIPEIIIEEPDLGPGFGDYSTNILFKMGKLIKNDFDISQAIISDLSADSRITKIFHTIGNVNGFINFYLSKEFFNNTIKEILKNKNFGKNQNLKGKKVIVEYTDPNPFKEFHIGHLMSNAIGESISRIFEFQSAKVKRANYQGDVGLHVAKAIWGKMKNPNYDWQTCYFLGSESYNADEVVKREITELNKKIFERSDNKINKIYDEGREFSLKYFEQIYKRLGTKFDYYFFESQVAGFGKKIVEGGLKKGIFQKGDNGAVIFKGEDVGLHTRVFINSEGLPTYEAKELGLAKIKYDKYKYDESVIITGNEVDDYFKVLLSAMSKIFSELEKKTKHIGHGMLRLPHGKMSSRSGSIVAASDLLKSVRELVFEKIKGRDLLEKERNEIIEGVAIGAVKYSILKQSIGSDIIFDFEKSISFEGDSGPYLQYSYARARSILKNAKAKKIEKIKKTPDESSRLERLIYRFPKIIKKTAKEYQPHYIILYLTELAHEFNNYYAHNKIVDKEDEFSPYKVAVTEAFAIVMKNGLWLLGIPVLEKM